MDDTIGIVFLGTGSPLPSPVRCGAGQVILAGDTRALLDCGWGMAGHLTAGVAGKHEQCTAGTPNAAQRQTSS